MPKVKPIVDRTRWPDTLQDLSLALIADYHMLRSGKFTVKQAQAGAKLAETAIRAMNLQLLGVKYITEQAKLIAQES